MIQRKGTGYVSDWWGLGVLIFEMLTGDPPFKAVSSDPYDTFRRALAGNFALPDCLSPEACDLISRLLQARLEAAQTVHSGVDGPPRSWAPATNL